MKKGLLSLLAVALTVVGCQNYDDQFDDLKTQITDLAATVAGLTQVQSALTDLANDVDRLDTAISAIPTTDSVADLTAALSNQSAIIDSLSNVLASSSLTQDQLAQVSATLALVQADVQTLLQGDSVISPASGGIIITNEAQLGAAENLVPSDADPGTIVLDGFLDVRVGSGFLTSQEQLNRANAVLAKFATVIGTVNFENSPASGVTGGITADNLASSVGTMTLSGDDAPSLAGLISVGGSLDMNTTESPTFPLLKSVGVDFNRTSGGAPTVSALRTVGRDLNARHTGAWNYSQVTTVGGNAVVPDNAESINLTGVTVDGNIVNWLTTATPPALDSTLGRLTQTASTTGAIILGTAGINTIEADSASSIEGSVTSLTSLDIDADSATYVHFNAATSATGDINVDAATSTTVRFDSLSTAGNITITDSSNSHLEELDTATGTLQITAENTVDLQDLTSIDVASTIDAETVLLNALESNAGAALTLDNVTSVTFPDFVATAALEADSAESLTLKSISVANLDADSAETLTLSSLDNDFLLNNTDRQNKLGSLTTLSLTTSETAQQGVVTTQVDIAASATLTTVSLDGKIDDVSISGLGITTLNTSGFITDIDVDGTSIVNLDFNHDFIGLDTAVTITVNNNAKLVSVDMEDVDKVKTVELTANASLTTLTAPAAVYPEAGATINLTVTGAGLAGTWTEGATATRETETVLVQPAVTPTFAVSGGIAALLDWFEAADDATTPSGSINVEFSDITFYERTRNTDGSTTVSSTPLTTAPANFGAATTEDSYYNVLYPAGNAWRGTNANLDSTTELSIVTTN